MGLSPCGSEGPCRSADCAPPCLSRRLRHFRGATGFAARSKQEEEREDVRARSEEKKAAERSGDALRRAQRAGHESPHLLLRFRHVQNCGGVAANLPPLPSRPDEGCAL